MDIAKESLLPSATEEEWQKRSETRTKNVQAAKDKADYKVYLETVPRAERATSSPMTPDPNDRTISKRSWKMDLQKWVKELQSWHARHTCTPIRPNSIPVHLDTIHPDGAVEQGRDQCEPKHKPYDYWQQEEHWGWSRPAESHQEEHWGWILPAESSGTAPQDGNAATDMHRVGWWSNCLLAQTQLAGQGDAVPVGIPHMPKAAERESSASTAASSTAVLCRRGKTCKDRSVSPPIFARGNEGEKEGTFDKTPQRSRRRAHSRKARGS